MIDDVRNDSMMAHLLDALDRGEDIGHYGRLVFTMIARHFADEDAIVAQLQKDRDFSDEQARALFEQVRAGDYSPPKRAKILDYQRQQDFPIIPNIDDPDSGNVYRTLKFPDDVYEHIAHYREARAHANVE